MGVSIGLNRSPTRLENNAPAPGDPVPERFHVLQTEERNGWCLASILYPDAKNYEGNKFLLYNARAEDLRQAKALDPHFQEVKTPLVPVARFEPTADGWAIGLTVLQYCAGG